MNLFDLSTTHWCVVHRCLNPGDATSVFVEDSQGTALECLFAKAAPVNQYMLYLMYLYFNFVFAFAVGIQQAAVAGSVCKIWPSCIGNQSKTDKIAICDLAQIGGKFGESFFLLKSRWTVILLQMCWLFRGHLVGQSTCWLLCNLQYFTSNCVRQLCPRNWQRLLAKAISDNRRRRRKIATGNLPDYKSLGNLVGFYFCCARDLVVTQYTTAQCVV